jgi:dienelactone hydrolase
LNVFRSLAIVALLAFTTAAPAADAPDYAALRKKMALAMGPVPGADRKVPLDVQVVSEEKLDGYVRKKITFASEKDDRVPAWLLIPTGRTGKRPAMLCLHQTINIGKDEPVGLGKQDSKAQALHLVKRGYVCLAPDYPSFGEYKYDFQAAFKAGLYQSGTMKAIWNNMRAVDLLQSLPEVDADRIGAIGHSLGGHNTLYTAAFDDRIKVAVSSCGFNSFHKYYGGNLKGWTSDRYMPRIASEYGNDPKRVPFDFDDVLLAICPRAVFAMAPLKDSNFEVSGVKDVIAKVEPAYKKLGAEAKLKAIYPDAGHEWPEAARKEAYEFVDKWLKP